LALAKKQHFTFDELREIYFIPLVNILIASTGEQEKEASQDDINNLLR
jgi:hypothetical protein